MKQFSEEEIDAIFSKEKDSPFSLLLADIDKALHKGGEGTVISPELYREMIKQKIVIQLYDSSREVDSVRDFVIMEVRAQMLILQRVDEYREKDNVFFSAGMKNLKNIEIHRIGPREHLEADACFELIDPWPRKSK